MSTYDIVHKLEQVGADILDTSRSELYMSMKFLAMAFGGFKYAASDKTGGIGTDGYYIYYSPMFLIEKYRFDLNWINRAYLHMIFHCIFRHPSSREGRQREIWDIACDIAAEHLIDSMSSKKLRRDMTAEKRRIYSIVDNEMKVVKQSMAVFTSMIFGFIVAMLPLALFYLTKLTPLTIYLISISSVILLLIIFTILLFTKGVKLFKKL